MQKIIKDLKTKTIVKKGQNYVVANISDEVLRGDMRGWICGHFYPKGSAFHRNDIEICFKELNVGMTEKLHHHLCSFEFLLVLSGKVEYEIDGDRQIMTPGTFYMLHPGNTERIVEVHEETTVIAVRLPSVPENKVLVKEKNDGK
jgi:mannose-6-phosphate isomerase-like protein (cupin superfamily)